MRKGTTLFLLAALTLSAIACLTAVRSAMAADTLELTDSGAPSAIVIFPVGEKPNSKAAAMPPVAFNHVIHEKWMEKTGKNCLVCHHTGDPVACTNCHTVQGSEKAKGVTLYTAMHAEKIAPRAEDTPSSCVSCHQKQIKQRDCAGCHTTLVRGAMEKESYCAVCHTITPSMTKKQMQAGIDNKIMPSENEKLATATALARKQVQYWAPKMAPYKVDIDELKGKYEPCMFNHRHHVISLMERIQKNQLAGAFHTDPATICVTCHHHSAPSATPPKCVSCHTINIDRQHPDRPRLLAAYHLQCMSCHKDMKVARPRNSDCTTCHKLRPERGADN